MPLPFPASRLQGDKALAAVPAPSLTSSPAPSPAPATFAQRSEYLGLSLQVGYGRLLFAHLKERGLDPARLYSADALARVEAESASRIALSDWLAWVGVAERELHETDLALRLTEHGRPWHSGVLGFATMTSPTIQEVGHLLARFQRLITNVYRIRVMRRPPSVQDPAAAEHRCGVAPRWSRCCWAPGPGACAG